MNNFMLRKVIRKKMKINPRTSRKKTQRSHLRRNCKTRKNDSSRRIWFTSRTTRRKRRRTPRPRNGHVLYSNICQETLTRINTASGHKKKNLLTSNFKALIYLAMKHKLVSEERDTEFSDMSLFDKVLFVIDLPFDYARKFTLPPCEKEKYEKKWAVIFPIPGLMFMMWIVTFPVPPIWILLLIPIGGILSIIIYFTSEEKETPCYYPLLEFFGTIGALMWTYLVSGILIDLL
jgi:hypothetical protein